MVGKGTKESAKPAILYFRSMKKYQDKPEIATFDLSKP